LFFKYRHGHGPGHEARDDFGRGRHGGPHWHWHRHGGGFRGREGERERVFEHGDLRLVIMAMLKDKPRYGYEIIKDLEERVGGGYSPSPGVVYPTLTMLEEMGHATVTPEPNGRKLYTLSIEGLAFLEANRTQVDAILARIAEWGARRGPPVSVLRAMENLAVALRLRMKSRPATDEQIRIIAAALDAAARAIEES
jgi:DNA-binding PadR family transcriptional regulator